MAEVHVLDVTPPGWGENLIAAFLIVGERRTLLVETGPRSSAEKLLSQLEELGARPDTIIVTHIHLDHAGGVGLVARRLGATVLVHPRGYKHLIDPSRLWRASRSVLGQIAEVYGEPVPVPEEQLVAPGDGTVVPLDGRERVRIIHTPGHASHHMVVLLEPEGVMFTGDAAGVSVELPEGRLRIPTTPPPFKAELYIESLQKMAENRPARVAPTHYGLDPMDGTEYISEHILQTKRWLDAVRRLVEEGVDSVDEAARRLAEMLPEARLAASSSNPIIYETFYKSTVWGMLEYVKDRLSGKKQ